MLKVIQKAFTQTFVSKAHLETFCGFLHSQTFKLRFLNTENFEFEIIYFVTNKAKSIQTTKNLQKKTK